MAQLTVGQTFESWDHFERAKSAYCIQQHVQYSTLGSRTVGRANATVTDGRKISERLKYSYIKFGCKHFGKTRTSSRGIRPNQKSFKIDCQAYILVTAVRKKGQLLIKELNEEHNHELSEEIFQRYPEQRRLDPRDQEALETLLNLSVATSRIRDHFRDLSGKSLTSKDVHNLRQNKSGSKAKTTDVGDSPTCWLMKSEPERRIEKGVDVKFGIEDLKKEPNQTACWDGVRNYQARNFMRDQMKVGQKAFFYHSNCKEPGIAGIMEIIKEGYPDHTQFDKKDIHYDSSAKKDDPRWCMVDVKFKRMMHRYIPLSELKAIHQEHKTTGGPLANVALFTRARLSVQPLTQDEWDFILSLEKESVD